ncbi:TIR-like protein FxsC [Phytohabitans kaempferiae]|uniref:TIR-like protein FxsC n=1 Tax=Phytohabitans kaempferiae TaxID=1620943 RepID=A0ABV6MFG9_9ACTN
MTTRLVAALARALPDVTALEVAEAVWLAQFAKGAVPSLAAEPDTAGLAPDPPPEQGTPVPPRVTGPDDGATPEPVAEMYPDTAAHGDSEVTDALRVGAPRVPALPAALRLARAMRPLRVRVPSRHALAVDEAATAERIAVDKLWVPVRRPVPEPRFNLALIADGSPSMLVWDRTVDEFQLLLQQVGAFRTISTYAFDSERLEPGRPLQLEPVGPMAGATLDPSTIVDPTQRLLILVVTDGIGRGWHDGRMDRQVQRWAAVNHLQVVNVLPRRLWRGTGLRTTFGPMPPHRYGQRVAVPVVELSPDGLSRRAQAVASGGAASAEVLQPPTGATAPVVEAEEVIQRFFHAASPTAQRLAGYFAAAPLTLPIMRLIQHVMLPTSTTAHLAEVFVSGMLVQRTASPGDAELTEFDFLPGVRDLLLEGGDRYEVLRVLTEVSRYVSDRLGQPLDFPALLVDPEGSRVPELSAGTLPVARIAATVLRGMGSRYALLADRLDEAAGRAVRRRIAEAGVAAPEPAKPAPLGPIRLDSPGTRAVLISGLFAADSDRSQQVRTLANAFVESCGLRVMPRVVTGPTTANAVREAVAAAATEARDLLIVCCSGAAFIDVPGEPQLLLATGSVPEALPLRRLIRDIEGRVGDTPVLLIFDSRREISELVPPRWHMLVGDGPSGQDGFLDELSGVLAGGDPHLPAELTVEGVFECLVRRARQQGWEGVPVLSAPSGRPIVLGPNRAASDSSTPFVILTSGRRHLPYVERLEVYLRREGIPVRRARPEPLTVDSLRAIADQSTAAAVVVVGPTAEEKGLLPQLVTLAADSPRVLPLLVGTEWPDALPNVPHDEVFDGAMPSAAFLGRLRDLLAEAAPRRAGWSVTVAEPPPAEVESAVAGGSGDESDAPIFFLSYVQTRRPSDAPRDDLVMRFFDELSRYLGELVGRRPGWEPGFMDRWPSDGEQWSQELLRAVGTCQVFVPLISGPYLSSRWCGREWHAFSRRSVLSRDGGDAVAQTGILPVLWSPTREDRLPRVVREIQSFWPTGLPDEVTSLYMEEGLYGLYALGREDDFKAVVWRLAQRIVSFHREYWVAPGVAETKTLRNVFAE